MKLVTISLEDSDLELFVTLLKKLNAQELSELRRVQTQLFVYDDRRSTMNDEPKRITRNRAILDDVIRQIEGATAQ